jgi:DNA-binding GntR family transcriptional regulator
METKISSEQRAYELIKDAIVSRSLAPGTQLVENTIAEKLNISRTPIRNALKRLKEEGLINIITNKGAFVVQPSIKEIEQAFKMREELELITLKTLIGNAMNDDLANLNELVDREEYAFKNMNMLEYTSINKEFHMVLAGISGNSFLVEFTGKIIDKINVFMLIYDIFYKMKAEENKSVMEHRQIIKAIKDKDTVALEAIIRQHLKNSYHIIKIKNLGYKHLEDLF